MSTARNTPCGYTGWLAGIMVVFFFLVGPGIAAASEAVVNTGILNVRGGSGPQHRVIDQVKMGERLPVLEKNGDWYKVRLPGGNSGWVAGWLVKIQDNTRDDIQESPAGNSSTTHVVIRSGTLNVRGGPGTGNNIVDTVHKGDRFQVLDASGDWYKIMLSSSKTGWVAGWLVDVERAGSSSGGGDAAQNTVGVARNTAGVSKQAVVKGSTLNVRGGPGTSNPVVAQVKQGDKLSIISSSNGWCKVQLPSSKTGWVAGWLVDVKQIASPSASGGGELTQNTGDTVPGNAGAGQSTGSMSKEAVVKESTLNVRGGPGTSHPVVARVQQGDRLPIVDSSNGWCKVQLPGGGAGWLAGWLVDVKAVSRSKELPVTGEAVVHGSNVNVRGGPGTDHQVLTRVTRGERMSILEKAGEWYKVQLSGGAVGWIAGSLVQVEKAAASTPGGEGEQTPAPEGEPQQPDSPGDSDSSSDGPVEEGNNAGDGEDKNTGPRLTKLHVREVDGRTVVTISANASMEHNIFTLTGPDRLVVDLIGIKPGDIPAEIEVSSKLVSQLRTGWFSKTPDTVRLVFDVQDAVMFTAEPGEDGKQLTLEIYVPRVGDYLKGRVIAIDPGHGGSEPGTSGPTGLKEKDVNLAISLLTADLLRQNGARVVLTRSGDTFVGLQERPAIAAREGAEVFISIHNNGNPSPSKHGTSTYYRRDNDSDPGVSQADNKLLAEQIQAELLRSLGRHDLGINQANFVVLKEATMPAVLLEISFVTNPEEERLLKQLSYQTRAAEAITRGIANYFARKEG